MASASRTCPECGAAVAPRDAGCPSCGRILDRGEPVLAPFPPAAPPSEREGDVASARSGGTGWRSCLLAGCGCLGLAGITAAILAFVAGRGMRDIARGFERVMLEADLIALRRALEEYADDHGGRYPERLEDLTQRGGGDPWIEVLPEDRWHRPFVFEPPPERDREQGPGRLLSLGRDGELGGAGEDLDLDEAAVGIKPSPR